MERASELRARLTELNKEKIRITKTLEELERQNGRCTDRQCGNYAKMIENDSKESN